MIQISCPFCGIRDHSEFSYGGDGSIVYPALDAPMKDWHDAVISAVCKPKLGSICRVAACRCGLNGIR